MRPSQQPKSAAIPGVGFAPMLISSFASSDIHPSRARVTQLLNLLKLPSAVVACLHDCENPAVLGYFTERRLRSITAATDEAEVVKRFSALLSKARGPTD